MKIRFLLISLMIFPFFPELKAVDHINILGVDRQIDTLEYRVIGPGADYTKFNLPEYPLTAYMITVDLNNPWNLIETFQAQNHVGKTEAMTSAYSRLNHDGHKTIAGVNGNFWIVANQGQPDELLGVPHSGSIMNGEMVTDPNDWNRGHGEIGFAMIDKLKKMWIDDVEFIGKVTIENNQYLISQINRVRNENELVMYNSFLGAIQPTRTDDSGIEVYIRPVDGAAWTVNSDVECEVTSIVRDKGANLVGEGESLLSGTGNARTFLENLSVGSRLTVNMGISTLTGQQQPVVTQMITGNALVMKNGVLTNRNYNEAYNTQLYPRTGIASSQDGKTLYMIVIDKAGTSVGANTETMCGILKACGASDVTTMDGGGSAQMMLEGAIVSNPSDGKERPVANGWFLFHNAPEDNNVVEIRFEDVKKEVLQYSMYTPVVLGYNRYGVLVDYDVQDYTLSCSAGAGHVQGNKTFVASGQQEKGTLTLEYNGAKVSKEITILPADLSLRLKEVLIDNKYEYPVEIYSTTGKDRAFADPQLFTWTVQAEDICVVENGVLRGLKNGTTTLTAALGAYKENMEVTVEIPASEIIIQDRFNAADWELSALASLNAAFAPNSVPGNWNNGLAVDFTYNTGRGPFIKLTNPQPLYSLPDSIKIIVNTGNISLDKVNINLRANNSTNTVSKTFNSFIENTDIAISFALNEFFDTQDIAVYPVWFDNIHFYLNSQTAGNTYTLALKEIQLIYNELTPASAGVVKETRFHVFPNPVAGNEVYINTAGISAEAMYQVYNLSGQKVLSGICRPVSENLISLSLQCLEAGIYFIDIRQGMYTETVKVIKQ